jgi:hypothetical protein
MSEDSGRRIGFDVAKGMNHVLQFLAGIVQF